MLSTRIFTKNILPALAQRFQQCSPRIRNYCSSEQTKEKNTTEINRSFLEKFKIFQNTDREIVYDIEEERKLLRENEINPNEERRRRRVEIPEFLGELKVRW